MRLATAPVPRAEAVPSCLRGLATALEYAHGSGLVHRDIELGDVLLLSGRTGVVTGSGIVKALGDDAAVGSL